MKDTARKKDGGQESPNIGQLALAAMFAARTTLYETVIHAGMSVLAGMLEDDRTRLCGPLIDVNYFCRLATTILAGSLQVDGSRRPWCAASRQFE